MAMTLEERVKELERLHEESGKLLRRLPTSLRIREIWPQAFANNCSCAPNLRGTTYGGLPPAFLKKYPKPYERVREITRTYLKRSDNVEYDITVEEFFYIVTGEKNDNL